MLLADLPPGSEETVRARCWRRGRWTPGVQAGRPDGWAVQLALDAAHPLVLTATDPEPTVRLGLHDPVGGIAVVDGDRIALFGDPEAARLLREHLSAAVPLRAGALRVVARPPDAPPPPGRWTIRTRHAVFGVDR